MSTLNNGKLANSIIFLLCCRKLEARQFLSSWALLSSLHPVGCCLSCKKKGTFYAMLMT